MGTLFFVSFALIFFALAAICGRRIYLIKKEYVVMPEVYGDV
ncbi:hypothetical protein BNJ_00105 [Kaumoebavirus]|nr:hypothetical protein BNJ_00105 [Kaumoebavirus]ARA71942.1 hypothetical protein BNJ_00105 [Kaumoebavirus]